MLMPLPGTEVPASCAEVHWENHKILKAVRPPVGGVIRKSEVNEHQIRAERKG